MKSLQRTSIIERFPWVTEKGREMVVGTDLDALISALFMHETLGWKPIGFYNLEEIFFEPGSSVESAVWIDLDISQAHIRSIGHHVLTFKPEPIPERLRECLNPNLERGVSMRTFGKKYPLATIHLLMWLLGYGVPQIDHLRYLLWLPDSSFINAQNYDVNVDEWLSTSLQFDFLAETVKEVRTRAYEDGMRDFLDSFGSSVPLPRGRGQSSSQHLGLHGFQCRFKDPSTSRSEVQVTLDVLSDLTGWGRMLIPEKYVSVRGRRNLHQSDLEEFLDRLDVFSYVLPNRDVINFTQFEEHPKE